MENRPLARNCSKLPAMTWAIVLITFALGFAGAWFYLKRRGEARFAGATARFGQVFENLPVPVFVIDAQHRVTHWNRACERVTGTRARDVIGTRDPWRAFYPAARPVMADVVLEGYRDGQLDQYYAGKYHPSPTIPNCYEAEDFFPHMGTEGVWLAFTAAPLFDDDGRLAGAIETLVDITDRKRAERAMQAGERRFRTLIEQAPDGIVVYDVESSTLVDANPEAERLLGQPRDRLIGSDLQALVGRLNSPEAPEGAESAWRSAVADAVHGGNPSFIWRFYGPDGRPRVCDVRWVRLPSEDGRVYLRGSIADVTDRQMAEEALVDERNFLNSLLEAIPVPVFYKDRDGRYLGCNDAFIASIGRRREEVIGRSVYDLAPADIARRYAEKDAELFAAPGRQIYDWVVYKGDGSVRNVVFNKATFVDREGDVAGLIGVILDVTELKEAQTRLEELNRELEARVELRTGELRTAMAQLVQSEKLAALGHLVAGVAHEMSTPIGNVLTISSSFGERITELSKALLEGRLKRSEAEALFAQLLDGSRTLERNAVRAGELIANFKQVAVDQASARRREFDLARTVTEILQTIRPLTKARREIDIVSRIPDGIVLDSFPGPLEQVVTNFVVNSLTHAFEDRPQGRIEIGAEVCGAEVRLVFADDGGGMTPEVAARIFDPFFTTKLGRGGSGLGLYLVHAIVTGQLGGSVRVDSAPGRGTRFEVVMPMKAPDVAVAVKPHDFVI
jgi:PAS domain S-box-containing protein